MPRVVFSCLGADCVGLTAAKVFMRPFLGRPLRCFCFDTLRFRGDGKGVDGGNGAVDLVFRGGGGLLGAKEVSLASSSGSEAVGSVYLTRLRACRAFAGREDFLTGFGLRGRMTGPAMVKKEGMYVLEEV